MIDLLRVCIVSLVICEIRAKRDFTIELTDIRHKTIDSNVVKFENHSIQDRRALNYEFSLHRNVSEFDLKFKFDMMKKDNNPMNILKITVNGCKILRSTPRIQLLKQIFREIFRTSNLPRNCAIMADTLYFVRNFTLRADDYPAHTPQITWQFNIEFMVRKKSVCLTTVIGRVRKL